MAKEGVKPESLYRAYPKKLIARIKLPSHLNQLRFLGAKVKDGSFCVISDPDFGLMGLRLLL